MKKNLFALIMSFSVIALFAMPLFVLAQVLITPVDTNAPGTLYADSNNPTWVQNQSTDGGIGADDPRASNFQLIPCDGVKVPCNFVAFVATFNRILKFLLYMSIPLVVGIILYTGFQYLRAGGDAHKLEEVKKMLVPVAIGIFWVLASWLVVSTILKTFLSKETKIELNKNPEFQKLIK